jgi:TonB-dependent receptor
LVEMTTTEFPSSQSLRFTMGAGYLSSATGNEFRKYSGGLDWLGRGGQPIPSAIPDQFVQRKSILNPNGFTPAELQVFGQALIGDWTGSTVNSASPAMDFALTYGNTLGRLGIVLSGVTNHTYNTVDEVQRFFGLDAGNVLVPRNDYDLTTDRESVTAGAVANLSYRLTDNNRVFLNSVLTRDASNENRFQSGLNGAQGGQIRDYRVRYQLEQVLSTRLRGEHNLSGPGIGSLIEWNVARSRATNDSDLRENGYREADPGTYDLQVGFSSSGEVDYYNLDDKIQQGGAAYTTFFAPQGSNWSGSIKAGYDHLRRTRDFSTRRFAFTTSNPNQFDLTLLPEQLFTLDNIRPGGFEIREVTGVNDAYDAEHTVDAGYLMTDSTFGKWRFIGGARYESSDQRVTTFNPFDVANEVNSVNQDRDLLPSVNLVYESDPRTNLRFGYGRTINRPEFRELSPFAFVEVAGGRSIAGNPDLVEATLDSYDVRWERFPAAGEVFAVSAFYKSIDRPIERIVQPTSDFRTSFINAESASLYGAELEVRRGLGAFTPLLERWAVNANYAWIHSEVNVGPDLAAATSENRTLQGQADQSANLAIQYTRGGTLVRVLGAYIGKRLTDVGAFGLPDIFEEPYTSFDAVVSQRINRVVNGLELKLAASNLFDKRHQFTEGGLIQRAYDPGRTISLSLSYTPF